MTIRIEEARDHQIVSAVVKEAFESAEHTDGHEHELVAALRSSSAFVPDLSLVAEQDGRIVGHIMFTEIQIGETTGLALAPLSVLPPYQYQGVGTALVHAGHEKAKQLGYGYSVVLGSDSYYPRFGYLPAVSFGIRPPFEAASKNFMAVKLIENAPLVSGVVRYAKEFGLD